MNLFSRITLRDLTLKNRIAVLPMQQHSATSISRTLVDCFCLFIEYGYKKRITMHSFR
jgi:hypothetical protein